MADKPYWSFSKVLLIIFLVPIILFISYGLIAGTLFGTSLAVISGFFHPIFNTQNVPQTNEQSNLNNSTSTKIPEYTPKDFIADSTHIMRIVSQRMIFSGPVGENVENDIDFQLIAENYGEINIPKNNFCIHIDCIDPTKKFPDNFIGTSERFTYPAKSLNPHDSYTEHKQLSIKLSKTEDIVCRIVSEKYEPGFSTC